MNEIPLATDFPSTSLVSERQRANSNADEATFDQSESTVTSSDEEHASSESVESHSPPNSEVLTSSLDEDDSQQLLLNVESKGSKQGSLPKRQSDNVVDQIPM